MPQYVLGISCFYHDAAACLLKDGTIIAAAEEERFTRKKHDSSFPEKAIEFCLKEAGINAAKLMAVGFYEKPLLKFDRILVTFLETWPRGFATFLKIIPTWLKERLRMSHLIQEKLKAYRGKIAYIEHHLSHAASAFYCSPFENAALLTMDGVGEWTTAAWGRGAGRSVTLQEEMRYPHSLGLLYSTFTAFLGFEVNEGEYKVMGLAPYGKPLYEDRIKSIAQLNEDGSLWLDSRYFAYQYGQTSFSKKFIELFGSPRLPESGFEQIHYDIAASIQKFCEEVMVKMARYIWEKTGEENLCLAGGVALNCVGNSRIKFQTPFKNIFIQPAAGDSGGAIGVAYYLWNMILKNERTKSFGMPYFGPTYDEQAIETYLKRGNVSYRKLDHADLLREMASMLVAGKVVGLFRGKMEFGPRALGHRSILADPRPQDMRERVNGKIKFRESFRPFAPMVLMEEMPHWFETSFESPYMLFVAYAKPEKHSQIPAVTHLDRSARIQTLRREEEPFVYDLIREFEKKTGVPILLNTSFNRRGEPIVESPKDALDCFLGSGIDALVLDHYLVVK